MSRSSVTKAIVLKTQRFAEVHKHLTLLTTGSGIIDVTAYGAYKGKNRLSGSTDLFALFTAYLYFEPVKKNYKLTDLEPISLHDGIRRDVKRFYIASFWVEIVYKTYAGGDEQVSIFPLLVALLTELEFAEPATCDLLNIQFLYRFLHIIGYPPLPSECSVCGRHIRTEDESHVSAAGLVTCRQCALHDSVVISVGAKRYLNYISGLDNAVTSGVSLDKTSTEGVKTGLIRVVKGVVERPLFSLETGGAYL